jgi:hypothetical protein
VVGVVLDLMVRLELAVQAVAVLAGLAVVLLTQEPQELLDKEILVEQIL